jgi:hypothetical protein
VEGGRGRDMGVEERGIEWYEPSRISTEFAVIDVGDRVLTESVGLACIWALGSSAV